MYVVRMRETITFTLKNNTVQFHRAAADFFFFKISSIVDRKKSALFGYLDSAPIFFFNVTRFYFIF